MIKGGKVRMGKALGVGALWDKAMGEAGFLPSLSEHPMSQIPQSNRVNLEQAEAWRTGIRRHSIFSELSLIVGISLI
jgi:hypothetical protein